MSRPSPLKRIVVALLAIVAAVVAWVREQQGGGATAPTSPPVATAPGGASRAPAREDGLVPGEAEIVAAYEAGRGGVWVESAARVYRVLPDDREGVPHQRFLVRLTNGLSVKISHNIDLARRIEVEVGDVVRFRGRYEANDLGGVVHWTHHDPRGGPGGWLENRGRRVE